MARVTARSSAAILPAPVSRGGRGGVQAGNVCVATRHLLRSVSAARSGCLREAQGRSRGSFLRASPEGGVLVSGMVTHRAAGGPRVEPSGVPRPRGDRPPCGRGGSVESRPPLPSGSARCLDRGSHDSWFTRNNNTMSSSCTQ